MKPTHKLSKFASALGIFAATVVITYAASSLIPTYAPGQNPPDLNSAPLLYRIAGQTDPDAFDYTNDSLKAIGDKLDTIQGLAGSNGGGDGKGNGFVMSYGDIDTYQCSLNGGYANQSFYWVDNANKEVYVYGFNTYYDLGLGSNSYVSSKTKNPWFDGKEIINFACGDLAGGAIATIRESDDSLGYYAWGIMYNSAVVWPFFTNTSSLTHLGSTGYGYTTPTAFDPSRIDN